MHYELAKFILSQRTEKIEVNEIALLPLFFIVHLPETQ